jgi:gamma-glutamyltranspeptidase/glutathione hydrolase
MGLLPIGLVTARRAMASLWVSGVLLSVASAPADAQASQQVARSGAGMVVSAHPLATFAGVRTLERGGNAADAAVATAFAIAVVEPSMNSIGGRNQILIRTTEGRVLGIDGTTQVPPGYDPETAPRASYGYATIGIPGALAGLMRLHDEHGSLPLETVMAPAVDYARHGFRLNPGQARFHEMTARQLAESEGARESFLTPDGSPHRAGEQLRQPILAGTLEALAQGGADLFYRGEIAAQIAADMERNGGYVTREALAQYRAEDARIVRGSYRGFDLAALDIPASGPIAIQALHIMERFERAEHTREAWALITAQALGLAITDLPRLGSDTAAARATSKEWAAAQAERVRLGAGEPATRDAGSDWLGQEGHTTHLSVADSSGMVVSLTQTLGPAMGSRVATPGLGFLYAVTLGGYLSAGQLLPGERARSGITPLLVLEDGEPVLVLGAAGGLRIISAVVQAVSRVVDDDMAFAEALAAPRVHPGLDSAMAFSGLSMETSEPIGWTEWQVEAVRGLGFRVTTVPRAGAFGRIHGIRYHAATGEWEGVADPDWEGTARGPGG